MTHLVRNLLSIPVKVYRSVFRASPRAPVPDNLLTADIDKLDQHWRGAERVRARQLAVTTKGGRG